MKNLKKVLSVIITLAMLLSSMPTGMAEEATIVYTDEFADYMYSWTEDYSKEPKSETVFMCVTDAKAKTGTNSMLFVSPESGAKPISLYQRGLSATSGEYTLSFWVTGDRFENWRTMVSLAGGQHLQCNLNMTDPNTEHATKVETDGEWSKYEYTFVVPEGKTNTALTFIRQGNTNGVYVDDISLKDANGNELLTNGGFEDDGKLHWTDENSAYFYGWTEGYEGRDTTDEAVINKDAFMCVTDINAKDGNYSMLINDDVVSPGKPLQILQKNINTPAGTYTFSMWLAGTYTGWRTMVKLGDSSHQVSGENGLVKGETVGDWTKYTATITLTEDVLNNTLYIMRQGYSSGGTYLGTFIDNVSLKDANGNELLANGGFESDGMAEYTDEYEEYFCGWTRDWAEATPDYENIYMNVTDKRSKSGKYSMLIKNNVASADGPKATAIVQNGLYLGEGTYTLSLWLSGSYKGWRTMFKLKGADGVGYNESDASGTTVTTASKGATYKDFTNYIFTYTVSAGKTATQLLIQRQGVSDGVFIDDISLTDANGNELLSNGGFEMKGDLDACINPIAYPTSEGNAITLTWKNPAKAYDAINIYFDGELQTGVEADEISTEANAFNEFYYSGIENYTEHTVGLEAIRGGEVVYECELPVWTDDLGLSTYYAGNQPITPWKYVRMENTAYGYANTIASVDYAEKASGSSSIKLTGNLDKVKHQCYPNITQKVTLDQGVKYVLSFKAKLNNVGSLFVALETSELGEKIWGKAQLVSTFATSDWKTYIVPLVFENENGDTTFDSMNEGEMYSANIMIAVERMVGSINIDDVKVYAVEEDDETYTPITQDENLIENGGFEFGGYVVEDAKFEVSNGSKYVKIDKIQSGNIKVTTAIRNNSMGDDFEACTIIAVYNNGNLVSVPYILERAYDQSSVYLPSDKYMATVSIPEMKENDKYEIKVLYWDGFSSMMPLDNADCLN